MLSDSMAVTWPVFDRVHALMAKSLDEYMLNEGGRDRVRFNKQARRYEILFADTEDDFEAMKEAGNLKGLAEMLPVLGALTMVAMAAVLTPDTIPGLLGTTAIAVPGYLLAIGSLSYGKHELDAVPYRTEPEWLKAGASRYREKAASDTAIDGEEVSL